MSLPGKNEEPHLHLREESITLAKVLSCFKPQNPHHSTIRMLSKVIKHLLKGRTLLALPFRDTTVGVRDSFERCGGTERAEEGEGH